MKSKKWYVVMVSVETYDDMYDVEYSGIQHTIRKCADAECEKARKELKNDDTVQHIWVETYPDCIQV